MEDTNYTILVVDDEPDILEFLSYNLRREGYNVHVADNGKDGLRKAQSIKPHLIVLDIMMPEMDGVEVCRRLRDDPMFADTIITFLTARNEDYSQIAGFDVGADDYITKPIRPRVFLSRMRALLRRHNIVEEGEEGKSPIIKIAELLIDREKYSVERNGEPVHLAKKEFDLLVLLVSKPGKVFSREEIFSKVWGTDVIVGNRTIDVHIRKLREKIGEDQIKTVKGIGYKFEF